MYKHHPNIFSTYERTAIQFKISMKKLEWDKHTRKPKKYPAYWWRQYDYKNDGYINKYRYVNFTIKGELFSNNTRKFYAGYQRERFD